ncbi:MAG: DUF2945 domain-containing protein [Brevundimonas sp.]
MPDKRFDAGGRVKWDHSQGATTGKAAKTITSKTDIKGHKAAASSDNPEYIVEGAKTGARAAHKPAELNTA